MKIGLLLWFNFKFLDMSFVSFKNIVKNNSLRCSRSNYHLSLSYGALRFLVSNIFVL